MNNRGIDVGFEPDFVIVKTTGQIAVFRTSTMPQSPAASSKQSTAAAALVTNRILDFDAVNGGRFIVGTNAQVNAAGSIYYWTAFKAGAGKMAVGTYTGNSATPVSVTGLEFSPEAVFVMGASAQNPVLRVSGMANSTRFSADAGNANRITSLNADGFTVGTDGDVSAAPGTVTFHYVAWNEVKGEMDIGSYTGNATDNRNITGVGFSPELVIVKNVTRTCPCSVRSSLDFVADSTANFTATANATNKIQALQSDGFQVGTNSRGERERHGPLLCRVGARAAADPHHRRLPRGRGGQPRDLEPELPARRRHRQGRPLCRRRDSHLHDGRRSREADDWRLRSPPNLIQSLDPSGFTIGTNATVNSSAGCPSLLHGVLVHRVQGRPRAR